MLMLPTSLRVFAKAGPTDMRRSFEGLVGIVERELHQQVESGVLSRNPGPLGTGCSRRFFRKRQPNTEQQTPVAMPPARNGR